MKRILLVLTFIVSFYLNISINNVYASGNVIFEDNFNSITNDKWIVPRNTCSSSWTFSNGKYGMTITNQSCVSETTPSEIYWNNQWNDYSIEVDIEFISGTDKNIAWRYKNPNEWVDIHFIGSIPVFQRLNLIDSNNIQPLLNGNTYHFRIDAIGNNHKVWYYNINTPDNISFMEGENQLGKYLEGRPALQASAGSDSSSSVAFDNVVVTDLSQPQHKGLEVPHFSQIDPEWKDFEYDSASMYNPVGSQEIEDWGCALTSSAMILSYHGFDTTPDGQVLTPATLNEYLVATNNYTKFGGIIWSGISSFAADAATHSAYLNKSVPKLEFDYSNFNITQLATDLEASTPGIIKIATNENDPDINGDENLHFVVAHAVENDHIYINDPLDLAYNEKTISQTYPDKRLIQTGRFIPTHSDLSYFWFYQYNPDINILVEHNGQKTGIDAAGNFYNQIPGALYFQEGNISQPPNFSSSYADSSSYTKVFMLPKPDTGEFQLTFSASTATTTDTDLHIFDSHSQKKAFDTTGIVTPQYSTTYTLSFDKENASITTLTKRSDFSSLRSVIIYSQSHNWLPNQFAYRLLNLIDRAERFLGNRNWMAKIYLNRIDYLLKRYYGNSVTQQAYDLIKPELDLVITQL